MSGTPNREAFEAWNGDSGQRWVLDPDRRDEFAAPVAEALLTAARILPDEAVLDVGCGCGATTLAAGRSVGSGGSAHGIDLSEPMLSVARRRLDASGLANVVFTLADAQTHSFDPTHDVAISRFGTMFFDDPAAAFANIGTALRPGGRLCIATWQPLLANEWLTLPGAALLRFGTLPDPGAGGPGMFAQSEPEVITATLARAGYGDIQVDEVEVTVQLGDDPRDATEHLAGLGIGRAVLATIAKVNRATALDAVTAVLQDHVGADGVRLRAGILVTTATTRS